MSHDTGQCRDPVVTTTTVLLSDGAGAETISASEPWALSGSISATSAEPSPASTSSSPHADLPSSRRRSPASSSSS
eukprot:CAMPEP_0196150286 /NCGR_PEP_ID=MMETSP0910-20130528/31485_1 /TAXON_ID=49265 /ORGANISM="Thalassiosira rotula, Strain GSO102" /LENGTH=75 /DNA_ID=CAMNT_0041413383 /DNA_START=16 /DNA_END=240 /DNA_ORIENTATION=+